MKKGIKLACKILSVFLSVLLVIQIAPMQIIADAYHEATVDENTENTLGVSLDDIDTTDPEAEILAEETSKREQYVKHFRMSDGSYRATQYEVPVHFIQDGEWTDYDNTLVEVDADTEDGETASNKDLKNTLADYSVRLSKKTNGKKFVRIEKDGYKLSWYYTKANKVTAQITEVTGDGDETTLEKLSSQVVYEEVYKDTDFEYIVGSEGLKENIILKSEDTQTEFVAEYKANGLTPVQVNDKTIELRAADGTVVYTINAPYMTDANMEYSDGITLTLSNVKNNKFTVTTTLDESWLNDNGRAYPVTVDPVIETKKEYGESDSTFVGSLYPNRCYHTYSTNDSGSLYVGNIYGYGQTESYLKVNTLPTLGVADKVVYAQIDMGLITCELGMQLDVRRVKEAWSMSSVTWNNKPESEATIVDYKVLDGGEAAEWISFEITDLVRGWYSNDFPNYGISFSTSKTSSAKVWMCSTDFNENGFAENRPVISIVYRNMSGYEDYWSYTGVSAGRNGAVSINNFNGNAVFSQPITMSDGGNLMPVALSLVYNSNGSNASYTFMGSKIKTNYHISMHENNVANVKEFYRYYMDDADGTRHWFYFEKDEDGNYPTSAKDEDGLGYTIYELADSPDSLCEDAKFKITDKNDNKMYFTAKGYLMQITDSNGNSAKITYEKVNDSWRMKNIEDGAGRFYTFNYANSSNPILCTSITDPAGRETSFTYTSGYMTKITFPDGEECSLGYSNYLLTQVTAIDGTRTTITYDTTGQKRVSNINWGTSDTNLLESYSFTYKQNETKITDKQGREYTYQFNNFGQTTGIVSNEDGKAQYFDYTAPTEKDSPNANKLISQSKVIHSVTNYIVNSDVEDALSGTYRTTISDTTGTPTISLDTTKGNLTKNSIKVYKPAENTGYVYAYQVFSGLPAGTYTFSCYVNTYGGTTTGKGVYVGYRIIEDDVFTESGSCEDILTTDGWERVSLTFNVEDGEGVRILVGFSNGSIGGSGTAWFDDFQLEKSAGPSSYNLLDNSGFTNGKNDWSNSATLNTLDDDELLGFTKAISKVGSPTEEWLGLSQFVYPNNGKKGDVFSIGSWIKADSAPINNLKDNGEGEADDDRYKPRFALALHFYNSSGTCIGTEEIAVNDDLNTWQFVSGKVIAPADYSYCCFEVIYYSNVNTVMMTGGFCYREEFGQTYDYDENGNVASVVDISNSKSSFAFKGDQMAKMLNPSGSEYFYSYAYNESDLAEAVSTDGQRYSFTYDDKGNVTSSKIEADKPVLTIESGKHYIIRNAESGNVIDNGQTVGKVHNWRYRKGNTNQIWLVESAGETGVYYLKSIRGNGFYMAVENNSNTNNTSMISTSTAPSGNAYKFKIQSNGDGTFTILTKTSNYAKCVDGQPNNSKDYSDKVKILQCTKNANDDSQRWYFYPDISTASGATQQDYIYTSATYTDDKNFVSTMTDQRGNVTTYNYDQNKGTLTSVTDAKNNTTSYVYNANTNALQSVTSGGMTNSYTYVDDRLTEIIVNGGTRYKFNYDDFGRTKKTQVGNGTNYVNLSELEYNDEGLLSKQTYGNRDYITFGYDNLDRLTTKSYNGSSIDKAKYFYGADGNIARTIDYSTNTNTKYVYDLAGRLVSTRDYTNGTSEHLGLKSFVEYTYADKTNYLTGIKHFNALGTQNIGYRYGNMSNGEMPDVIYGVTWNGNNVLNYTYDSLGRLTSKATPLTSENATANNINTTYTYFDVNNTKTTTLLKSISAVGTTHNYEYDQLGNITSIYDGSKYNTYEYDDLNQLVRENLGYVNKTYTYEYVNGNIKYKHEYAYTTGTLPATPLKTTEYHYEDSTWSDVLTGISEVTYTNSNTSTASAYSLNSTTNESTASDALAKSLLGNNFKKVDLTANGLLNSSNLGAIRETAESNISTNTTTNSTARTLYTLQSDEIGNITNVSGVVDLEWNGRRLESISQNGTEVLSYKYNIDGQRVSKTYNGETTEYFYNGSILAGQKRGNNVLVFMYDNNGDVFGFTYNGTPYYYVKNAQNDVFLILDEDGMIQVLYQYDSWGKVTACYDATDFGLAGINPIMYRSYYVDLEMGFFMYYLNSRYYMADWGRFISADGILGVNQDMNEYNLFAYCSNDPINNFDLNGCGKISNWFKAIGQKISNWWNSTPPSSSFTIPSTSQAIGKTSDIVLGTAEEVTNSYTRTNFCKIKYSKDYSPSSTVTILDGKTTKPYSQASKIAKGGAATITGVTLALDLGNTWTENNSNTNGDRVLKSVVQVTCVAAGVLVGAAASAAFAACATVSAPLLVGGAAFIGVTCVGTKIIDVASQYYYDWVGIE